MIVRRREEAPIETTVELVDTINSAIPAPARFGGGHPAKRSFQALRIAVNESWSNSTGRCRSPGACCARAAYSPGSAFTRSRTGA